MNMIKKGIGVVGSTTIDKIVRENRSIFKLGGVTTYSGITYSRHGIDSYIVTNVAKQDRVVLDKLYEENIIVFNGETDHTSHFVNTIKEDMRYQELPYRARSIESRQVSEAMGRVDGLHLGPLHPHDIGLEALNLIRSSNLLIFLDVQGYTRKVINKKVCRSVSEHLSTALAVSQIIKANGTELKSILDFYQMNLANLMLRFKIDESVITLGETGGFVVKRGGEKFHYDASKIEFTVDPTGAGDVFFAAYIVSRFLDNREIPDACRYAAQIAEQQVEGKYITIDMLDLT